MTNTLIVLSRMEEGLQTEMVVEFPLSDMAEEIVTAFQALAKVQQKELRSSIMPMILGNCELVSQLPNKYYFRAQKPLGWFFQSALSPTPFSAPFSPQIFLSPDAKIDDIS